MRTKITTAALLWVLGWSQVYAQGCPTWESYAAVRGRDYSDSNINPKLGDVLTGIGWTTASPDAAFTDADTSMVFEGVGAWHRATRVTSWANSCDLCSVNQDSVGGYLVTQWRTPPGVWLRLDSVLFSTDTVLTDSIVIRNHQQMRFIAVALKSKLPDTLTGGFWTECCLVNVYPVTRAR